MGTLFISLAIVALLASIFINIVDYSVYTYKRNAVCKAMDYAVSAAVQQIDEEQSREGLASGFSETTGKKVLQDIVIDTNKAEEIFTVFFRKNSLPDEIASSDTMLLCTTYVQEDQMHYTIKAKGIIVSQGVVTQPSAVQEQINEAINSCWPGTLSSSKVAINGNSKTNMLENGTYLFVFLNNIKISGVYSKRYIDLSGLAGAKVER